MDARSPAPLGSFLAALLMVASAAQLAYAQQPSPIGFPERPELALVMPRFQDRDILDLTATLDRLLTSPSRPSDARATLWNFARQLQAGQMTPRQEAQVLKHLDAVAKTRPAQAQLVGNTRRMVTDLMPGKIAPEIIGKDLDGTEMRLSDYRGKVVVLVFSADWCGICRTLNPYERLLQELYKNWPFAILSVETGQSPEMTRKAKTQQGLTYRSWWDGTPDDEMEGPIASAWNVGGLPTLYVIDGNGVIRFVDLRYEDLLKGVRQLLTEQATLLDAAAKVRTNPGS